MLQYLKSFFTPKSKNPPLVKEKLVAKGQPQQMYFVGVDEFNAFVLKEIMAIEAETEPGLWFVQPKKDSGWTQVFLARKLHKTPQAAIEAETKSIESVIVAHQKQLSQVQALKGN